MSHRTALKQLLQGYLNFDWPEEYGDPWSAVADFLRSEPEYGRLLGAEIAALLRTATSEGDLRQVVLGELGSGYLPEADGWTYAAWLREVARRALEQFPQ